MEHYSFQGAFAYRWDDDVPVERIDLRTGERRSVCIGSLPISPVASSECAPCGVEGGSWRSRMAAWN